MKRLKALLIAFILLSTPMRSAYAQTTSVTLAWDPAASQPCTLTGYNLYRSTTSMTYDVSKKLNAVPITGLEFTDTTAQPGVSYYYVATAVCGADESGFSNELPLNIQILALAAPQGLTVNCTNQGKTATISWLPVVGAESYTLRLDDTRDPYPTYPQDLFLTGYTATSYATTVVAGVLYNTWVGAFNSTYATQNGPVTATTFTCKATNPPKNLHKK